MKVKGKKYDIHLQGKKPSRAHPSLLHVCNAERSGGKADECADDHRR
jgi:hypothetical protein